MPNIKSAKKRLRQSQAKKVTNLAIKRELRRDCRSVRLACKEGNIEAAEANFRKACKHMDQAASKSIIHKNTASRVKSRLSACVKAAKALKNA
ncbi:MAG: 30S ribosomal protein S20 [Planctomycetia bacterium]|nr:30S ribosomal protein S20 [Planctomycetia bacterium]